MDDLGIRGAAFWRAVHEQYELTDAERTLLGEACRTLDRIDALEDAVSRAGVMVTGSTGQPVVHPAVAEARQQRVVLARLLRQLDMGDEDDEQGAPAVPKVNSERARYAAQQRWNRVGA